MSVLQCFPLLLPEIFPHVDQSSAVVEGFHGFIPIAPPQQQQQQQRNNRNSNHKQFRIRILTRITHTQQHKTTTLSSASELAQVNGGGDGLHTLIALDTAAQRPSASGSLPSRELLLQGDSALDTILAGYQNMIVQVRTTRSTADIPLRGTNLFPSNSPDLMWL